MDNDIPGNSLPPETSTAQFENDVVLKDGSLVHVRPMRPEDRPLLVDFISKLSPNSLHLRFLHVVKPEQALKLLLPGENQFALVVLRDEAIIGHAIYAQNSPGKVDAAVIVADQYQGKGLGTILIAQLTQAAAQLGISEFEAHVAPENVPVLRIVRQLGFPMALKSEPGLIYVNFPASLLPETLQRFEQREAAGAVAAMETFFKPRAIAVIGASRERGSIGAELFHNILAADFQGPVYPVNANSDFVQSVAAYRSVLDCPDPVDLAFVVVPSNEVIAVARECAGKGVRSLVVLSGGFAERGKTGLRLQAELVQVCRETGMRLIGPNCMGIVNTDPAFSLNGQFSPYQPIPGRIGFLSQSGALGIAIIDYASRLGLGMSTFVSVGNKADISGTDLIQYWEQDEQTDLILLYLESIGNPRKFSNIARRVARHKPILAVRGGRSAAGFRATQSHSGAMVATSDISVDALFRQAGVIRTDVLAEMFDVATLLTTQPVPRGDRVAIITNAGGAGILAADACEDSGLHVPELAFDVQDALKSFLSAGAVVRNPVDMVASVSPADYAKAVRAVARDPYIDAIIVIFIPPMAVSPEKVASEILKATRELKGRIPILSIFMASQGVSDVLTDGEIHIPSYSFPEAAARALARAVQYGKWLSTPEGSLPVFDDLHRETAAGLVANALQDGGRWLTTGECRALLDCYGIPFADTLTAATPQEAGQVAETLGGRVALKVVGPDLESRTQPGAVRLSLAPGQETEQAAREMLESMATAGLKATGFIIQPMIPQGIEMTVGVTCDPLFGPIIVCGAGGMLVELLRDVAVRITPLTDRDADEMIRSLKSYPLLEGYRGGPRYDIPALTELLLRLGTLAEDVDEIAELDINPVIVLPEGQGVSLVDARIRLAQPLPPLPFGAKKR